MKTWHIIAVAVAVIALALIIYFWAKPGEPVNKPRLDARIKRIGERQFLTPAASSGYYNKVAI